MGTKEPTGNTFRKLTQSTAQATPYTRRPFKLSDRVPRNSSFYEFRERLKQAIRARNAGK